MRDFLCATVTGFARAFGFEGVKPWPVPSQPNPLRYDDGEKPALDALLVAMLFLRRESRSQPNRKAEIRQEAYADGGLESLVK